MLTFICEKCKNTHDGTYGSGRFCSKSCAQYRNILCRDKIFKCNTCNKDIVKDISTCKERLVCDECKAKRLAEKLKQSTCENCGIQLNVLFGTGRFCGETCARSYASKNIIKGEKKEVTCIDCNKSILASKRVSPKTVRCDDCRKKHKLERLTREDTERYCSLCNKQLFVTKKSKQKYCTACRSKVFSTTARKTVTNQSNVRRSKNEIEFYNLCKNHFKTVLTNVPMFNGWDADVIVEDFKIAILWNGVWHYKKITEKHSVKQVQNRDRIKVSEIKKAGYLPYIIKDMGKHNMEKVTKEFNIFLDFVSTL